jgi:flagellar assembly protein FliH
MSEILAGSRSPAAPVLWRLVNRISSEERAGRAAEHELECRIEQVRRVGLTEGLESGRADTERQLPATLENISEALAELERIRARLREVTERDLVRLAITVAARVIHRETVMDGDALAGLVKAAFLKVQSREVSRVRMHPALESVVSKTLEGCGATGVVLMPDSSLNTGELLFETSQGLLDASLNTQLGEIERGLLDQLGSGQAIGSI